jgi:hypothetical protein
MPATLPDNIDVRDPASERAFLKAVEFQIAIWQNKHKGEARPGLHTIFFNKVAYYSALQLKKKVSCGWYIYGPYLRDYREEYQDQNQTIKIFTDTSIEIKTEESAISKTVQNILDRFFDHYTQNRSNGELYPFLKYIYENHSQQFPKGKQYYLAKLELYQALHTNNWDPEDIAKKMAYYQRELSQSAFADTIEIQPEEISLINEFGDLIVDYFEKGPINNEYARQLDDEFSSKVVKIPALHTNIVTGSSYDEKTEARWQRSFQNTLKSLNQEISSDIRFYSKQVYGS